MSEIIDKIRARLAACPIPEGAVADWKDTRHFEIQTPTTRGPEFWWLEPEAWQLAMMPHVEGSDECQERCGSVLDYAVAYRGDVQALLAAIEEAKDEAYRECAANRCEYCHNNTPLFVDGAYIGHRTDQGIVYTCDAWSLRKLRPQAFEKP